MLVLFVAVVVILVLFFGFLGRFLLTLHVRIRCARVNGSGQSSFARPSHSGPEALLQNTENVCPHTDAYPNVHGNLIYNSQNLEKSQMSINQRMDEQNAVHPCNGIVFGIKKKIRMRVS